MPSSRPGDDASLLMRNSSVRVGGRQPVIRTVGLLARSSALQAEETGSIPVPSTSTCRVSSSGRAPGFQPGGGGIVTRTLLQSMSPWCSTAARRSPKPKDAVRIRAGMPSMLRKRRQRRRSLVQTRARRESGAQLHVMHSKLTRWKRRAEDAETLARYQPSAPDDCGMVYQSHAALTTPRTGAGAGDRNQFLLGVAEHSKAAACKADVRKHRVGESPTSESRSMPAWRNRQTHQVESLATTRSVRVRLSPPVPHQCPRGGNGKPTSLRPKRAERQVRVRIAPRVPTASAPGGTGSHSRLKRGRRQGIPVRLRGSGPHSSPASSYR